MAVPYNTNPDYLGREIETTYDLSNRLIKNYADVNNTARQTFRNFQDDAWTQNARLFQNQDNIRAEEFAALTQPGRLLAGDTFNKQNQVQNTVTAGTMPLAIDTGIKNAQLANRNVGTSLINASTAQDIARIDAQTQPNIVRGTRATALNNARVNALQQVQQGLLSIDDFNRVRVAQGDSPISAEELQGIVQNANTVEAVNALRRTNPQYFLGGSTAPQGQTQGQPLVQGQAAGTPQSVVNAFTGNTQTTPNAQAELQAQNDQQRQVLVQEAQAVNPTYTPAFIEGLNNIRPGLANIPAPQAAAAMGQMQVNTASEIIRLSALLQNAQQRETQRAFAQGRGAPITPANPQINAAMSEVARRLESLRRTQDQLGNYQRMLEINSVPPKTAEQILGGV